MPRNKFYLKKLTEKNIREEIDFPLQAVSNGKLRKRTRPIDILIQRIKFFLVTGFNDRVMESSLGSGIPNIIGNQHGDQNIEFITNIIEDKITERFRNVEIRNIDLEVDSVGDVNKIVADMRYKDTLESSYKDENFDKFMYENNYFTLEVKLK